jgi:hypothetical protein
MDLLGDLLRELMISVAADELRELLERLFNGDDLFALVQDGDQVAAALTGAFAEAGIDPDQLTDAQWSQMAELMLPLVEPR